MTRLESMISINGEEIMTQSPNFYLMWADTGMEVFRA